MPPCLLYLAKIIATFSWKLKSMYLALDLINSLTMKLYKSLLFSLSIFIVTFKKVRNSGILSNGVSNRRMFSLSCLTSLTYALSSTYCLKSLIDATN